MRYLDLGTLLVEVDGEQRTVGGKKPAAILALLLIDANRRVSVDKVMDALWGDNVTPGSAATVESHIARLRRVLEPGRAARQDPSVLVTDLGGYRLLVAREQADSLAFEQLAAEVEDALNAGDARRALARSEQALALWRGRPYEPFSDEAWARTAVANLDSMRELVRERRVDALLEVGDADRAAREANAAVTATPLHERPWAQLMLGLYRCGRAEDALLAYQRAREALADGAGLDPGAELQDLQRRVLDRDPHLQLARRELPRHVDQPPVHLPTRVTPLIGRHSELARLVTLIKREPMVTIVGAAGCGKTRLVIEVARSVAAEFPDGVWFIDLSTVDQLDLVIDAVISAIGLTAPPVGSGLDALKTYARRRRMLVVLDNCEHVLPAVETVVAAILDGGGVSAVLSTSREPLDSPEEVVWTLPPLAVPDETACADTADLGPAPALELFLARVRSADPALDLSDADLDVAARICVAVDGVPLALELAAARVRSCTLTEIAEQVAADPSDLTRLGGPTGDHRRTVRSAIDWTHRLLSSDEQTAHRRLAVLPGPFSRACAAAIATGEDLPAGGMPDLLARLVHRSLLESVRPRATGPSQFRQLATVRGHAYHQLEAAGESEQTIRRRDAWVEELLARGPRSTRADDVGWYQDLDDAYPVLRATLHRRVIEHEDRNADALLSSLRHFWFFRSRTVEGEHWLLNVLDRATRQRLPAIGTRFGLASLFLLRGRADLARPHLLDGLSTLDTGLAPSIEQLTTFGDQLGSVGLSAATRDEFDLITTIAETVSRLAEICADSDLMLLAAGLGCMAELPGSDLAATAARAADIFHAASSRGVLLAAWMACGVRTTIARLTGNAYDGLAWSDRTIRTYTALGGQPIGLFLETRANFTALAEQPAEAVRLYAASRHQARRSGMTWPRRQLSADLLKNARNVLGAERFDLAWSQGDSPNGADLAHLDLSADDPRNAMSRPPGSSACTLATPIRPGNDH